MFTSTTSLKNTVSTCLQYAYTQFPSSDRVARKLNQVAVPLIALYGMANIPSADGGPILYGLCVAACEAAAAAGTLGVGAAAALIACVEGCWPCLAAGPF